MIQIGRKSVWFKRNQNVMCFSGLFLICLLAKEIRSSPEGERQSVLEISHENFLPSNFSWYALTFVFKVRMNVN